jgi:hypothetical protein
VRRGWLGVAGASVPLPSVIASKIKQRNGLRVVEVVPGSPAGRAGVYLGDVILTRTVSRSRTCRRCDSCSGRRSARVCR